VILQACTADSRRILLSAAEYRKGFSLCWPSTCFRTGNIFVHSNPTLVPPRLVFGLFFFAVRSTCTIHFQAS
jgi:hypothetical protein